MDIYEALKRDHQEAKKLFDELEQPPHMNGESRDQLFTKLKHALKAHSEAEESVFYTQFRQHRVEHKNIEQAIDAHNQVARTLEVLQSMDKSDSIWLNKLMSLHDEVQHHMQEEEGNIFQEARGIFSQRQAEDMGREFQKVKRQVAIRC